MNKYKSGIIFNDRVELTPMYNDSHSTLLGRLKIESNQLYDMGLYVQVELVPLNGDRATDPKTWKYIVDQKNIPDWYKNDSGKYEQMFRVAVEEWVALNTINILGRSWTIKKYRDCTCYFLNGSLGDSKWGDTNNYDGSDIQDFIHNHELTAELKREFGNRLVPITTSLTSLDGLKDYGTVRGDFLTIPTLDFYRVCRDNIPNIDTWWWLVTPYSTPSGYGSSYVEAVDSSIGRVEYIDCRHSGAVRPFFILNNKEQAMNIHIN